MKRLALPTRFSAVFRLLLTGTVVGALGLLFVQLTGAAPNPDKVRQAEKVNLALRRTAHHLLRAAGDSTSRIAAVQQTDPYTYRLRLDHAFAYDRLPALLTASFRVHQITGLYDVAVLNCTTGALELGYAAIDLAGNQPAPCDGRSMQAGCYVLQVRFAPPLPGDQRTNPWPLVALAGVLVGVLAVSWRQQTWITPPQPVADVVHENHTLVQFGQSSLDVAGQLLVSGSQRHNLTYRETKLLRVLASRANEILERDQILKLVWEDEGVTVGGRSIDVFVSRLRKLLHDDPTIRIVAVHGVGYRLEVSVQSTAGL